MSQAFECARCRSEHTGRRLIIEQTATDDAGAAAVDKCWTLCPPCAEWVMERVGEASPWRSDGRTIFLPDTVDEPSVRLFALSRS
jgi:hypothetical protein